MFRFSPAIFFFLFLLTASMGRAQSAPYVYERQFGAPGPTEFVGLNGIAVDPLNGDIVIGDNWGRRIQVFDSSGRWLRQMRDAEGNPIPVSAPNGIAVDPLTRRVLVADGSSGSRVFIFDRSGAYQSQFGSYGYGPGQFQSPTGIAIDPLTRNIIVSDRTRVQVFGPSGNYLRSFGGYGNLDGQFSGVEAIAIDPTDRSIAVADSSNGRVQVFDADGHFVKQIGSKCVARPCPLGTFEDPTGVAIDPVTRTLYVTDASAHRVLVRTVDGALTSFGTEGDGADQFVGPLYIAFDTLNRRLVIADMHRVKFFDVRGNYLGQSGRDPFGNGGLRNPRSIAIDPLTSTLFVTDEGSSSIQLFDASGTYLRRLTGADVLDEKYWFAPSSVAIDPSNRNLMVADGNGHEARIRVFDASGKFLRSFGAELPQFSGMRGLIVDPLTHEVFVLSGLVYVFDNAGKLLRKIGTQCALGQPCTGGTISLGWALARDPTNGDILVLNGNRVVRFDAAGAFKSELVRPVCDAWPCAEGTLRSASSIAVEPGTNRIFILDVDGIKVFNASGGFVARFGNYGFGDGQFWNPDGMIFDTATRRIYVADFNNNRVQVFAPADTTVGLAVEYYNGDLDHYFMTADRQEQASVESGAVGNWRRTGLTFKTGGTVPACRFYGNQAIAPGGSGFGPNSHFYTVSLAECETLKALSDDRAPSWMFESNDFRIERPLVNGSCIAGRIPVYRAYNGKSCGTGSVSCATPPNHRFSTSGAAIDEVVMRGWVAEGPVMCAPQ